MLLLRNSQINDKWFASKMTTILNMSVELPNFTMIAEFQPSFGNEGALRKTCITPDFGQVGIPKSSRTMSISDFWMKA